MTEKKRLVLLDGHALAYRAFHALPATLTSPSGELTNAVYGFTAMLLKVLQDVHPDYIAVAFDVGRTFRHDQFPDYKAHRAATPEELHTQMARIREIVSAFNIPVFTQEGYEADDVLGTLAHQAAEKGVETIIVTGDSDIFQLIEPDVKVMITGRRYSDTTIYDEEKIAERYGLRPDKLIDFKALVGDTSDNIPGVRGVGAKTAARLLQQFGSLQAIYDHLDEVPSASVRKKLEAGRNDAFLSRDLVTIRRNLALQLDLEACKTRDFDRHRVLKLFRELGFRSLVDRLPSSLEEEAAPEEPSPEAIPTRYQLVSHPEELVALRKRLEQAETIALDVETTATDAMQARLVGLALSPAPGEAYYLPLAHGSGPQQSLLKPTDPPDTPNLDAERVRAELAGVLTDPQRAKIAHNGKYDLTVLTRHSFDVQPLSGDTMIAAWLLNPASRGLGLKALAWERLGVEMTPISELIGKGKKQITIDQVPLEKVMPYACADVDMTLRLSPRLTDELREKGLWDLYANVEMPLVPVLMHMEMHGVMLDVEFLGEMSQELGQRLDELEEQICALAGHRFNINSTPQLRTVLFDELGLPVIHRTKTGPSTDARTLEALKDQHEIVALLLEHRQLSKLRTTYVDALPRLVNPETGRLHTSYKQTGTETGRLSSADPNLQNIPIRTPLGRKIRRSFIAPLGHQLVSADYSQVELRVLAHLSGDENLRAAFLRGEDIHARTAADILDIDIKKVTPDQRRLAKTINFGIVYGMGEYGLAQRTELNQEEARQFIESYFARYPNVKDYLDSVKKQARENGYVETILGRRRYFPELRGGSRAGGMVRRAAERAAINMPVQGSAADIMKLAMLHMDRELRERGLRSAMILQVHDELVFEAPDDEADTIAALARQVMSQAYDLTVPLKVDVEMGPNWRDMEAVT
jgi:DNA polymerase-1